MAPILDGLLDADIDLLLLSFALHDHRTHSMLAKIALLKPCTSRTAPHQTVFHRPRPNERTYLHVPHLRLPWASTLCHLVHQHLEIHLVPPDAPPSLPDLTALFPALANRKTSSDEWRHAVATFYAPLTPACQAHNQRVLAHVRAKFPPKILERFSLCVRLAFANTLVTTLTSSLTSARAELTRLQARSHEVTTLSAEHTGGPRVPACVRPSRATACPVCLHSACLHSACLHSACLHSACLHEPGLRGGCGRAHARSVGVRGRSSSPPVMLSARAIPSARGCAGGPVQDFSLVHGKVVRTEYLSTMADLARSRYGLVMVQEGGCAANGGMSWEGEGSLAMLSNRGGALLRGVEKPRRMQMRAGRADGLDDRVDAYLQDAFGTCWTTVCAELVRDARGRVEREREGDVSASVEELSSGLGEVEGMRREFIERAVVLEVAGSSLSRICAFAIVKLRREDVEEAICRLGEEYGKELSEAKCRVRLFEEQGSRFASTLVAGMAGAVELVGPPR